jgi:hypothetical protein
MRHGILTAFVLVAIAATPALAAPLTVPDQQFTFDALGTPVTLPVTADIDVVTEGGERVASGSAVGNLGDLQAKALPIARAIPLPKEPCANPNGINIVVDAIQSATITAEGNAAKLEIVGTVTGWGCLVGAGAPVATTQLALGAPVAFDVQPEGNVGLTLVGPVELVAAGLPADLTALLSDQINGAVNSALAQARVAGPMTIDNIRDLQIALSNAEFFDEGGTLMVRMEGTSRMSEETYQSLLTELGATEHSGI